MYHLLVGGLVAANIALGVALVGDLADRPIFPRGVFDCCEAAGVPEPYCCSKCCWLPSYCESDEDCR